MQEEAEAPHRQQQARVAVAVVRGWARPQVEGAAQMTAAEAAATPLLLLGLVAEEGAHRQALTAAADWAVGAEGHHHHLLLLLHLPEEGEGAALTAAPLMGEGEAQAHHFHQEEAAPQI